MNRILLICLLFAACNSHQNKYYFVMESVNGSGLKLTVDSFYAASNRSAYDSASKRYYTKMLAYKWTIRDAGYTLLPEPKQFDLRDFNGKSVLDSVSFIDRSAIDTMYSSFINHQLSQR